ncbi:hypothetical protein PC116_g11327 [Phytophthora cactorum]|nr:hypothetical protein PC114_g11275 [Phytophthora cactorum]KAG4240747.1 hypothetical protein PC116_g11327 [Phytophthora cactorum]
MRLRRESKAVRALGWQHAMLSVLVLSSLLYTGFIVSWTLQSPVTRRRDNARANTWAVASESFDDKLLRGSEQDPLVETSLTRRKKLTSGNAVVDLPSNSSKHNT